MSFVDRFAMQKKNVLILRCDWMPRRVQWVLTPMVNQWVMLQYWPSKCWSPGRVVSPTSETEENCYPYAIDYATPFVSGSQHHENDWQYGYNWCQEVINHLVSRKWSYWYHINQMIDFYMGEAIISTKHEFQKKRTKSGYENLRYCWEISGLKVCLSSWVSGTSVGRWHHLSLVSTFRTSWPFWTLKIRQNI